MSNIVIQNYLAGALPLLPPLHAWTQRDLHAHQNDVYQAMVGFIHEVSVQAALPSTAAGQWLEDGRLRLETADFSIWLTPRDARPFSVSGSSIAGVEALHRASGDVVKWEGLLHSSGLPLVSPATADARTMILVYVSRPPVEGLQDVTVVFDGDISASTGLGSIHRYWETVRWASGLQQQYQIVAEQPVLAEGIAPAQIGQAHVIWTQGLYEMLRMVSVEQTDLRTDQVTLAGLESQARAGDDDIVAWGAVGIDFTAGPGHDRLGGTEQADLLAGGSGNDSLYGREGDDLMDGGAGIDTVHFTGTRDQYQLSRSGMSVMARDLYPARDETDRMVDVEQLSFVDMSVDLTMESKARALPASDVRTLEEMYVAFFDRIAEAQGLGYWMDRLAAGASLVEIAGGFHAAGFAFGVYSATMTAAQFAALVQDNLFGLSGAVPGAPGPGHLPADDARGSWVLAMLARVRGETGEHAAHADAARLLDNKAAVTHYYAVEQGISIEPYWDIAHGRRMADLVTPVDTEAAIALIGLAPIAHLG